MEDRSCSVDHVQIEIKALSVTEPTTFRLLSEYEDQRVSIFRHLSGKNKNTWIISLFVVFHIVAFSATMFVNDCWQNSHGDCALKSLGRFSFQQLSENPLLGPSRSTLDQMGALRKIFVRDERQTWRLLTFTWLHAGAIHLIVNLPSLIFIGIRLEQEFGTLRIALIYVLSALYGSLVASLFVQNSPAVGSSAGLFGLLGAMLSGIFRNWNQYTDKFVGVLVIFFVAMINLVLGLLPLIDNFSNIGGFMSGSLLGLVLLFKPQSTEESETKGGLFDYGVKKRPLNLKHKLDRPVMRSTSLALLILLVGASIVAFVHGIDGNKYCSWCQYIIDCVPSQKWICNEKAIPCESMVSSGHLTLTCTSTGNFRILHYTNVSKARMGDLCSLVCS